MRRLLQTFVAVAALTFASAAAAKTYTLGALSIEDPWARATPGMAANGAAYMVITNAGQAADELVDAASPVAAKVELHTHVMDGDVMRMRPVRAIEVNVGEPAVLKPGGLHIMLIGLKAPLKQGETFPLTLTFAKAGTTTVEVVVQAPGAGGPAAAPGHQH
jgi:copper(I)-binding protein